ncbi:MAG: hypothetical protein A2107_00270 [Verrucomicrobia bacterium GWF2_62_7]|nr:MAG: hypothetical protein A2107_00270 [Verrucomicrobia bacterium GWF2_62_7]
MRADVRLENPALPRCEVGDLFAANDDRLLILVGTPGDAVVACVELERLWQRIRAAANEDFDFGLWILDFGLADGVARALQRGERFRLGAGVGVLAVGGDVESGGCGRAGATGKRQQQH